MEVSTSEGHLLAIFDPDCELSVLRELLVEVGIGSAHDGDLEAIASCNITDVAEVVTARGGVAIAAHVDAERGFRKMVSSGARRKRIHADKNIVAFETTSGLVCFTEAKPGYERIVPIVQGSDSWRRGPEHELDACGERSCWICMDVLSIDALRQALLDPDIRICLPGNERRIPEQVIEGMWLEGGFLNGQQFRFSDDITCLIGGTGSGKSLSLELLRFAFSQQVSSHLLSQISDEVNHLMLSALEDNCTVNVLVRKGKGRFLVRRSWIGGAPTDPSVLVMSEESLEEPEQPVDVATLFPIRAFSQSEIIEYSRQPLARLSLVDELVDHSADEELIHSAKSALRSNADGIIRLWEEERRAREGLVGLEALNQEILSLERFAANKHVRAFDAWKAEKRLIDKAERALVKYEEECSVSTHQVPTLIRAIRDDLPSRDILTRVSELTASLKRTVQDSQEALVAQVGEALEQFALIRKEWEKDYGKAEARYKKVLEELDASVPGAAAAEKKLSGLRERQAATVDLEADLHDRIEPRNRQLMDERHNLLNQLQGARRSIRDRRTKKARQITKALDDQVRLRIASEAHSEVFVSALLDLRKGSRVQEKDIKAMGQKLHPVRFVRSMLERDFRALTEASALETTLFERLHSVLEAEDKWAELLEVQLVDVEDIVEIQFAVETNSYRDLSALAHGQKCTVVLMIAMAEGTTPLLVDQPEDALHAPWIEDYIVRSLRRHRGSRQSIFATRSASVLVSSDAEQVIAMKADAGHGTVDRSGGLDRYSTRELVLYHVEGGEEPFKRRRDKYGVS